MLLNVLLCGMSPRILATIREVSRNALRASVLFFFKSGGVVLSNARFV